MARPRKRKPPKPSPDGLTDQQRNLLEVIRAAGPEGREIGAHDHRPAGKLVELRLIEHISGRRYRALS